MLSRFEVTCTYFRLTADRWNLRFSRHILRAGIRKFSKVGFKAWLHNKLLCKFRGDPLRDGWDLLSRNLGSKSTNQPKKLLRKNISRSRLPAGRLTSGNHVEIVQDRQLQWKADMKSWNNVNQWARVTVKVISGMWNLFQKFYTSRNTAHISKLYLQINRKSLLRPRKHCEDRVCRSVCLSDRICQKQRVNFTKFSWRVIYDRGSIILRRQCNTQWTIKM